MVNCEYYFIETFRFFIPQPVMSLSLYRRLGLNASECRTEILRILSGALVRMPLAEPLPYELQLEKLSESCVTCLDEAEDLRLSV